MSLKPEGAEGAVPWPGVTNTRTGRGERAEGAKRENTDCDTKALTGAASVGITGASGHRIQQLSPGHKGLYLSKKGTCLCFKACL